MEEKNISVIQDKIKATIVSVADYKLAPENIENGKDGIRKLGLNSLALIRMLAELEKEFDIDIDLDEQDAEILSSVDELANLVLKLKSENE